MVGGDGTIERANRRAARLYGTTIDDLVGEDVVVLVAATPGDAEDDPVSCCARCVIAAGPDSRWP